MWALPAELGGLGLARDGNQTRSLARAHCSSLCARGKGREGREPSKEPHKSSLLPIPARNAAQLWPARSQWAQEQIEAGRLWVLWGSEQGGSSGSGQGRQALGVLVLAPSPELRRWVAGGRRGWVRGMAGSPWGRMQKNCHCCCSREMAASMEVE